MSPVVSVVVSFLAVQPRRYAHLTRPRLSPGYRDFTQGPAAGKTKERRLFSIVFDTDKIRSEYTRACRLWPFDLPVLRIERNHRHRISTRFTKRCIALAWRYIGGARIMYRL